MMMMTIITQTAGFWLPVTENLYRQTKIDFWLSFNFDQDDHNDDYDDDQDNHDDDHDGDQDDHHDIFTVGKQR